MARKIEIIDQDLPDPQRRSSSSNSPDDSRRLAMWQALSLFAAAYATVHKLIIPGALSFTSLAHSPYTQPDPWILLVALWAWELRNGDTQPRWRSLLSGMLICQGVIELWRAAQGFYIGWLGLSHILSSAPPALASLAWLIVSPNAKISWGWTGALLTGLLSLTGVLWKTPDLAINKEEHPRTLSLNPLSALTPVSNKINSIESAQACGSQQITTSIPLSQKSPPVAHHELSILNCGFKPSILLTHEQQTLRLVNQTNRAVNIHFYRKREARLEHGWNLLLPPHTSRVSPTFTGIENSIGILLSDAWPEAGIVALVPKNTPSEWRITRSPLRVENGVSP